MPATVTLATTTLAAAVGPADGRLSFASTAGMTPGLRLYIDGEMVTVNRLDIDPYVFVTRGVDGTDSTPHASGTTVYICRADQVYQGPPQGTPAAAIPVSPYIDTLNSKIYFAQGDASSTSNRFWQQQTTTYDVGPLGVRTVTVDPTSST
jgi:hypothetical protein